MKGTSDLIGPIFRRWLPTASIKTTKSNTVVVDGWHKIYLMFVSNVVVNEISVKSEQDCKVHINWAKKWDKGRRIKV